MLKTEMELYSTKYKVFMINAFIFYLVFASCSFKNN